MAYTETKVGHKLKVWSPEGKKPGGNRTACVISSHGGQADGHKVFKLRAGIKVYFYGPEGGMLKADIRSMCIGKYKPFETLVGGTLCRDYNLTRFQGAQHGGGKEDYEYISKGMHPETLLAQMVGWKESDIAEVRNSPMLFDVVTIRNRSGVRALQYPPPNLSETIDILLDNGWNYTEFHCSFCRYASAVGDLSVQNMTVFNAVPK